MPRLRNQSHETFAQAIAGGLSGTKAYRKTVALTGRGGKRENDKIHACEWRRRKDVLARIAELQAQNARKMKLSREQTLEFLSEVVQTGAGQVAPDNRLCQAYEKTENGFKIRVPDKIAAAQTISRMCGWNQPEELRLGLSEGLTSYLKELRAGKLGDREEQALDVKAEIKQLPAAQV